MPVYTLPTSDFVTSNLNGAVSAGATSFTIATGLNIPAANGLLQLDPDSTAAVGATGGPETVSYTAYNSGSGAVTGVTRGLFGTTDVAHANNATVHCGTSAGYWQQYEDTETALKNGWNESADTWTYASASSFTITGADRTTIFQKGTKLRFKQGGGFKYAVVASSSFSTDTTVNIAVNTDYTIANAAITDNAYSYVENPVGWPDWFTFSPTWTNVTVGNGTLTARYSVQARRVSFYVRLLHGSTTSIGTAGSQAKMTLPIAPSSSQAGIYTSIGNANFEDAGTNHFNGIIQINPSDSNSIRIGVDYVAGNYSAYNAVTSDVPFTWTTNDILTFTGNYEF